MSKHIAQQEAVQLALEALKKVDIQARCALLGLPQPRNGAIPVRLFGGKMHFRTGDRRLIIELSGEPASPRDTILFLHYLLCEVPIPEKGELISFHDLPGGMFYWGPFRSRSILPLLRYFSNDLDKLRARMDRFDWHPLEAGDFAARVHITGLLYATLIYHLGDEEFPPAADLLFDAIFKHVLPTEDARHTLHHHKILGAGVFHVFFSSLLSHACRISCLPMIFIVKRYERELARKNVKKGVHCHELKLVDLLTPIIHAGFSPQRTCSTNVVWDKKILGDTKARDISIYKSRPKEIPRKIRK